VWSTGPIDRPITPPGYISPEAFEGSASCKEDEGELETEFGDDIDYLSGADDGSDSLSFDQLDNEAAWSHGGDGDVGDLWLMIADQQVELEEMMKHQSTSPDRQQEGQSTPRDR
jgi:hypothetical protein